MEPAQSDAHPPWHLIETEGLVMASCGLLEGVSGVMHAFSTRRDRPEGQDGVDFDLGGAGTTSAVVNDRRRRLCRLAGLGDRSPVEIRQVHGAELLRISVAVGENVDELPPAVDGVIALEECAEGQIAAVRTADCVPVLLAEPDGRAVAAIHAGWRVLTVSIFTASNPVI